MASPLPLDPRIISVGLIAALFSCFTGALSGQADSGAKPVLVELFTSEGCSDCPPADELLARLDHDQPIPGVHVVVLSEHVTYWNHQGWTDPFSMEQMDARQKDYQSRFHIDDVYTPQMVVDGAEQFAGGNVKALSDAMAHAASGAKQPLEVTSTKWDKDEVHFTVKTTSTPGTHLFAAIAEDVTRSEVSRGENAGRTLHHVAVVRSLKQFKPGSADSSLTLPASGVAKGTASLRLVVFLADAKDGRVVGVDEKSVAKQ
jgi:hypothetical protein